MGKRIAIIGMGWVGIGCLSILSEHDYKIDAYEKENDIGGVWHPNNWYAGLSIHGSALTVEYYDFPLPNYINKTESLSAEQIFRYLKSYCKFKKLYPYIHFNSIVTKLDYDSKQNTCTINIRKKNESDGCGEMSVTYDYVIYTHGFTDRTIPSIIGQEKFSGSLFHAFDVNEALLKSIIHQKKKVTIIGASKTATDFILQFAKYDYPVIWIYKKNYWFFRESLYRAVSKKVFLGKKLYTFYFKFIYFLANFFSKKNPKKYYAILRLFNLIHTYGEKHSDYKKYHGGRILDKPMSILKLYNKRFHIEAEINSFIQNKIKLSNGEIIESDFVIFCTGSGGHHSLIPIFVDNKKFSLNAIYEVYRSRVIPQIPTLIFTAFSDFNIGTINGLLYGKWISKYISSNPSKEYLLRSATKFNTSFFSSMYLVNSSEYFHVRQKYMLTDFFKNGELFLPVIKKWSWQYHFSNRPQKPYDFNQIERKI